MTATFSGHRALAKRYDGYYDRSRRVWVVAGLSHDEYCAIMTELAYDRRRDRGARERDDEARADCDLL